MAEKAAAHPSDSPISFEHLTGVVAVDPTRKIKKPSYFGVTTEFNTSDDRGGFDVVIVLGGD